jgi:hypothetical protein
MTLWVVIYRTNTGFVHGWLCKAHRVSDAETEFWHAMDTAAGKSIMCIAELQSEAIAAFISLYEEGEQS